MFDDADVLSTCVKTLCDLHLSEACCSKPYDLPLSLGQCCAWRLELSQRLS